MRFNKHELMALASQTSPNFDREGVLVLKEKQDGFFRRSEGCSVRWFRLKGNLLFYLKGAEPWYEPMGVIVLGHHQIKVQNQDENGHWPFQIVWENGVCYRMATFHESERTLWLKAIQMAPYEGLRSQLAALKDRLNRIRPVLDVATYRLQKGIITDMNEVPLCELALSCDNLLCDTHGRPPSPLVVVYVKFQKGLCVRYGATEIVDTCSNPSFCKTILFRASDGLTGDAIVRLVVYDVRERVSETLVPMGFTAMPLSTIQEAQRLRVALQTKDNKTVGFVTINGWSLEPSYIGTSPSHTNDKNSIDIPQKVMCHRRSQSLPPRLGVKLKFPSYGTLLKQNFVNSHQVTYRFHSGLGGDITVHEIMAEPKICYQMPMQLLDIYIQREKELLEELLSVGEMCSQWQSRYLDLVSIHVASLKQYCHAKRCMQHADPPYFKASSRKDEVGLEFAPVNLHLQRMWVYNDTLNKTGSHDIITVGAFTAHTNKAERNGGLIKQVQQSKDINSSKAALHAAAANKIQADSENVMAARKLREQIVQDLEQILMLLQAKQGMEACRLIDGIKSKTRSLLSIFDATAIEEILSYIGWPTTEDNDVSDSQTMSTIMRLTEQLSVYDNQSTITDCENYELSTSSSSKDTSPTADYPGLSSSVPNLIPNNKKHAEIENTEDELQFHNDYFNDRQDRLNHSFRSVKSAKFTQEKFSFDSHKQRASSLRHDFKSSASLEQVSYRCLMDNVNGDRRKNSDVRRDSIPSCHAPQLDAETRRNNLAFLQNVATGVDDAVAAVIEEVLRTVRCKDISEEQLEAIRSLVERVGRETGGAGRWLRVAHAALRLRSETPRAARERAALRAARDQCAAAALTTVTAGLVCWLSSTPADVVVKILTSGLGPLCTFEGLLSLYSNEKAMWGDMVVAVEDLHTVVFELVKVGHSNTALPQVSGTRGALTVHLPVSDSLYSRFTNKEHLKFTITAVFFNIGINEKATLAEARGETAPQTHSNSDNLGRILTYSHKHSRLFTAPRVGSSRTKPLEEVMENLRTAVNKKVPKNTEVLHMAALATRLMYGLRFTSCKSAKDRTGMSVTIEQCNILAQEYHLDEMEAKRALSVMRSEGCRRENTLKNIGVRKYAFTKKQVMDLPEDYRPPPGTEGCRRENTLKNIGVRKYAFTKKQVMDLPEDYRPPPGTYGSSQT